MVRQNLLLDLSFSPIQCFHTFAVWKHSYISAQSMECRAEMAHLLYLKLSDKARLEKAEQLPVFYWFASVKANFIRMFPHLTSSLFCAIT